MWHRPFSLDFLLQGRQDDNEGIFTIPGDSENGSFVFPRMWPMNLRETSTINISWATAYEGVNLYFYQGEDIENSTQIATNLATEWYQWEVRTEETNLTDPFVFHIVNARGTEEETLAGGFWSTSFYILRDAPPSITTSSVPSSTSSGPLQTSTMNPSTTFQPTETMQPPPARDSGISTGAIAGISVVSVSGAVEILAAAFIWHRKRKASTLCQPAIATEGPPPANEENKVTPREHHTTQLELPASQVHHELPLNTR